VRALRRTGWDVLGCPARTRHRDIALQAAALLLHTPTARGVSWRRICTPTEIFTWYLITPAPEDLDALQRIIAETPMVRCVDPFDGDGDRAWVRVEWNLPELVGAGRGCRDDTVTPADFQDIS